MTRKLRIPGMFIVLTGVMLPLGIMLPLGTMLHAQQLALHAVREQQDPGAGRDALEAAVRRNPSAQNLYALATAYCAEGSIHGRKMAIPLLKRAAQAEPAFVEARLLLARLFEGYARHSALAEYRDILKTDPSCAAAWYRLARLKEEDFYEWRHAANRVFTPRQYVNTQSDMQTERNTPEHLMHFLPQPDNTHTQERTWIPLMNLSREDFAEATHAYHRTIALDPSLQDAYRRLALLQMETGRHGEALPVITEGLRHFPRDIELHLLAAVCRTYEADFAAARASFESAFRLMTPSERRDYREQSTHALLEPRYHDALAGVSAQQRTDAYESFWAVADPLYLSTENEARLEHYSRIAMANLLFSHPLHGIPGWTTDRGKTLLRYGMPRSRLRLRPSIEVGSRMRLSAKTELWFYPGAVFAFTDEYNSGRYRFSTPDEGDNAQYEGNSRQLYEDLARIEPYRYRPSGIHRQMVVPSALFRFRSDESTHPGDLEVAIAYALPVASAAGATDPAAHDFGVFLLDDFGRWLFEKREKVDAAEGAAGLRKTFEGAPVLLRCPSFLTAPDSGNLSLEWLRTADGASAVRRQYIALQPLEGQPALSDIVLASTVARDAPHLPLQRGALGIAPYPWSRIAAQGKPTVYFEVYDLGLDTDGNADFDLHITLRARDDDANILDLLSTMLEPLGIGGDDALTSTTGYMTAGSRAQLYLQLDLAAYESGNYDLRVRVEDHVRGRSAEQTIPLELTE